MQFSFSLLFPLMTVAIVVIVGRNGSVDAFLSTSKSPCRRMPYTTFHVQESSLPTEDKNDFLPTDEDIAFPCSDIDAIQVTALCMDALKNMKRSDLSLEVCFNFSTDRCRAAVGGSVPEFIKYAANPVFGALVHCLDYEIVSIGPIIPGGQHRGEMQTVLMDVQKRLGGEDAKKIVEQQQKPKKRPTAEERAEARRRQERLQQQEQREDDDDGDNDKVEPVVDNGKRRFLWTLQKERRPPRQDCWLIHEVLFVKNAYALTL
jgi:hypothetical protein